MRVAWVAVLLLSGCVRAYGPPSTTPRADACRARLLPLALLPAGPDGGALRPARELQRAVTVLAASHTCDEMAALERQLADERRARRRAERARRMAGALPPRPAAVPVAPLRAVTAPPPSPFDVPDNPYEP